MKRTIALLCSVVLLLLSACSTTGTTNSDTSSKSASSRKPITSAVASVVVSEDNGVITYDLTSIADDSTALRNPDKGWYIHYYDNSIEKYGVKNGTYLSAEKALQLIPCLDHIYLRLAWSHLEPEEGKFNWELIDKVIDPFTKAGVGITFRISCKETDKNQYYATPEWVKKAGAAGTMLDNAWEPDYGDPIFLKKLDNFHKAFAARYDGRSDLFYIDVGSYGDWGEGHTASSSNNDWPWETIKAHFDIHKKYYKNTLICISDDFIGSRRTNEGKDEILNYVLENGWTFRDDSISVPWFVNNLGTQMRSPELFDAVWKNVPTILELDHYQTTVNQNTWRGGQIFLEAVARSHATYGGFHGYPEDWIAGNYKYAKDVGNKMGYWYFINKVSAKKITDSLDLTIEWFNNGAAKAYNKYGFDIILTDKNGNDTVFTQTSFDNTKFMPGSKSTTQHTIGDIQPGEYTISVRMYKGDRPVYLAINKAYTRDDGTCKIGDITI